MSDGVHIVEVGPRDGLQNEKTPISVADRIAFIEALIGAGLKAVEVGAFVSPKAIPQMVGSAGVLRGVSHHTACELPVLVPNEKGYEASQAAGAKLIAVFAAASTCTGSIRSAARPRSRSARTRSWRRCPGLWWHCWPRRVRRWKRARRS